MTRQEFMNSDKVTPEIIIESYYNATYEYLMIGRYCNVIAIYHNYKD